MPHILIHHYCSEKYLFQTITMSPASEREQVLQNIIKHKSWYWGRFAKENRANYMAKRLMAEDRLHQDFSKKYWRPKERYPVYFYLYPHFSHQDIEVKLEQRKRFDEPHTKYLLIDLCDLDDVTNISFTISDSLTSYRETLIKQGAVYEGENPIAKNADHGKIFHINEISGLSEKCAQNAEVYFEVQVWDQDVLNRWRLKNGI